MSRHRPRRALAGLVAALVFGAASSTLVAPATAEVIGVKGSAFGFTTNVSLFGGPSTTHGPTPTVTLPAEGSATPIIATAPEGGRGQYGPAVVFGGIWPEEAPTASASGPITVRTQGTLGPNGSVTSSVGIVLHDPPRPNAPGGIGPGPLIAKEAHSTCTATESGVAGSSRFVDGIVETKYDKDTQLPIPSEVRPIPVDPPPNQEYTGTIDHVGDHFRILINEQIRNPDGSLTVNAAHMFLLGPIAVGEMIVGQSVCGLTSGPSSGPAPAAAGPTPAAESPAPAPAPAAAEPQTQSPAPSTTSPPPTSSAALSPTSTLVSSSTTVAPGLNFNWASDSTTSSVATTRPSGQNATGLASRPLADTGGGAGLPLVLVLLAIAGGTGAVFWTRRRRSVSGGRGANGWH